MDQNTTLSMAEEIMMQFAGRTGLLPDGNPPRRYLWTDAFAVCNFIALYNATENEKYRELALLLISQVHNILGRHRADDTRTGWISGKDEQEGDAHPTIGGLRIGKELNERGRDEPINERLEWERDGQYYHYLTRWMHALNRACRLTGDAGYNTWAIELAKTAHAGFVSRPFPNGPRMMYWKMSIDLSYPLVMSMGQHDPLDGFITYNQLQAAAKEYGEDSPAPDLYHEIKDMANICADKSWATDDPLGLGALLCDAFRVAQLMKNGVFDQTALLETLLEESRIGMKAFVETDIMDLPAEYRLAFRELGLCVGLKAIIKMQELFKERADIFRTKQLEKEIITLSAHAPLSGTIENFWLESENQQAASWKEHIDINMVTLATSLAPEGYLAI